MSRILRSGGCALEIEIIPACKPPHDKYEDEQTYHHVDDNANAANQFAPLVINHLKRLEAVELFRADHYRDATKIVRGVVGVTDG